MKRDCKSHCCAAGLLAALVVAAAVTPTLADPLSGKSQVKEVQKVPAGKAKLNDPPAVRKRKDTAVGIVLKRLEELRPQAGQDEWAAAMRNLIELGPDAVPELIDEMDATDDQFMLRCLAFALRGIGDKRAVPALIRALPKACAPPSSDMGYRVKDGQLMAFMQKHDNHDGKDGDHYSFGRPINEIRTALQKLTGTSRGENEVVHVFLQGTPRQQYQQRLLFERVAEQWAKWWEANWHKYVDDNRYAYVGLKRLGDESPTATAFPRGPRVKIDGRHSNHLLGSVRNIGTRDVFHDFDTGRKSKLPEHLRAAEGEPERLDDILAWAAEEGFDLMGAEYTPPGSDKPHYVLRGLGLAMWRLDAELWKKLEAELRDEAFPMGPRVDGLLARFDPKRGHYVPEETGLFLFQTREGGYGAVFVGVEVHDDSLQAGGVSTGDDELQPIAFNKGRRFAYTLISEGDNQPEAVDDHLAAPAAVLPRK